jgi:hypothetical protein
MGRVCPHRGRIPIPEMSVALPSTKEKSPDVFTLWQSLCALVSSSLSVLIRLEAGHNKNINS